MQKINKIILLLETHKYNAIKLLISFSWHAKCSLVNIIFSAICLTSQQDNVLIFLLKDINLLT